MLVRILIVVGLVLTGQALTPAQAAHALAPQPTAQLTGAAAKAVKARASVSGYYEVLRGGRVQVSVRTNATKVDLTYRTAHRKKRGTVVTVRQGAGTRVLPKGATAVRAKARATKRLRSSPAVTIRLLPAIAPVVAPPPVPVLPPGTDPTSGTAPTATPTDSGTPTPTSTGSATPTPADSGTPTPTPTPTDPSAGVAGPFASVTAGSTHTCALDTAGAAWCWGDNRDGQLGTGSLSPAAAPEPVAVTGAHVFTAISAGSGHTCALDASGTAWCWGQDSYGQLGDGVSNLVDRPIPAKVSGDHRFTTISAGATHTCAVDAQSAAWCWGDNTRGALGSGSLTLLPVATPTAVFGGRSYRSVDAGQDITCAVEVSGSGVWCWGDDTAGRLGDYWNLPVFAVRAAPIWVAQGVTLTSVSVGGYICGIDTSGAAWCWGRNQRGQLGNADPDRFSGMNPVRVGGSHVFASMSVGQQHACAVDLLGDAWCWGADLLGQAADEDEPSQDKLAPAKVPGAHATVQVAAGERHSCLVETSGSVWCWGSDAHGQLGNGASGPAFRGTPTVVTSPSTT